MKQNNNNGAAEIFGDVFKTLLKAVIRIALLLFVGIAKLLRGFLGLIVEFIEDRMN